MIGVIFFVVGLILFGVSIYLNGKDLVNQMKGQSGKDLSKMTITNNPTSAGNIVKYVSWVCFLIALLYGFGVLGGSSQPAAGQVAGRRRRR
jgi:hypothetical protein